MGRKSDYGNGLYRQLEEVMERLSCVEKESDRKISELNDRIITLEQENSALKEENLLLRNDNARLKSILNNDSSNTSNPPSTDQKGGKAANTYNGRKQSTRKSGGQQGHKGCTLTKSQVEEKIKTGKYRHEVTEIGDPGNVSFVSKYVLDLTVEPVATEVRIYADEYGHFHIPPEYRTDVIYGANIKALAAYLYGEGVMSNDRIAAFLNAASNNELAVSEGSIYRFCRMFSDRSLQSIANLEEELLNQEVVCTDATVVTVNGKQGYIRNFSIEKTVLYRAMKDKTLAAMKKLRFLEHFTGTLVHDHETALYHFGTGHGECNVHIIRYLRKNSEDTGHKWSDGMIRLLSKSNEERKGRIAIGKNAFEAEIIRKYVQEYDKWLMLGREENKKTKHRYAKEDEIRLLNRMEKYRENHLLYLYDFAVPFDDNMSERDLRKAKNRQKMAGGFRKSSGHEMYCNILTVIETLKRRGMGILENIKLLFTGTPAIF